MSLISALEGTWSGLGQMFDAKTNEVLDTIQVRITLGKVSDTELAGEKRMIFYKDKNQNYDTNLKLEVVNEIEMTFSPPWAETPIIFLYMESPVSFQGSYDSDLLGTGTKNIDNNFIVDKEWQISIEAKSSEKHVIFEYVLEKED